MSWTDEKNMRRCDLIDRQLDGTISEDEALELDSLTVEFLIFKSENFPLPIENARAVVNGMVANAFTELHDRACKKMTPEEYAEQYESFGAHTAVSMEIVNGCQEVWVFYGHYVPKLILCPER